jgi:endonuclease/exonuclease/phosphatase (EEP) superfamily protein YafD
VNHSPTANLSSGDGAEDKVANEQKPRSLVASFLVTIAVAGMLLMLVSWAGRWMFAAELLASFQLQMGLVGVGLAVLLGFWGSRKTTLALLAMSLATLANPLGAYWPATFGDADETKRLRLMTFNILLVNRQEALIKRTILDANVDVALIVEYTPAHEKMLDDLWELYPHQIREPRNCGYGLAILSKHPISEHEIDHLTHQPETTPVDSYFEWKDDPYIHAVVDWQGQKIHVLGVHLFNPTSFSQFLRRTQQFERLAELVRPYQGQRLIVMGDLNCIPWSPFFRDFLAATGLRDSRAGFGYHGTWPSGGNLLSIPIDHVLLSNAVAIHHREVLPYAGSDHFPVVCDVSFPVRQAD